MNNKFQVQYHWDPLKVSLVGRSYPPEFYSWISNSQTRKKFETMAEETEEDYQGLIRLLTEKFGVEVHRPEFPADWQELFVQGKWVPPPTAPRDYFLMIQDRFFVPHIPNQQHAWSTFYRNNKLTEWPEFDKPEEFFSSMPADVCAIIESKFAQFKSMDAQHLDKKLGFYSHVFDLIRNRGNEIVYTDLDFINGCFVTRLGKKLCFGTQTYHDDKNLIKSQVDRLFPSTENLIVNSGGHGDATYCPVAPGLIISLYDIPTYADTFPDWEVLYLPPSNYSHMREFEYSMKRNKGRWFIPGFEQDPNLSNLVDHYFDEWVGQVSETVFDVNILIVDPKNIVVSTHNDQVEAACARHGIEVHVVPFRHKYFWDCGIHCVTNDLNRAP